jgi:hypothetical protein
MDANHQEILDNLEEKEPRSRLAPFRDLILELRRRHRTYREILQILADHCQIRVSISTLHDFLNTQRRKAARIKGQQSKRENSSNLNEKSQCSGKLTKDVLEMDHVQQKIAALKAQRSASQQNAPCFSYDPTQPLQLPLNINKNRREE